MSHLAPSWRTNEQQAQLDEWMSGETGLENRSNIYGVFGVLYQQRSTQIEFESKEVTCNMHVCDI